MAMRCKRCRGTAVLEVRRHNAAFCRDCFFHYVGQQVTRAIAQPSTCSVGITGSPRDICRARSGSSARDARCRARIVSWRSARKRPSH